MTSKTFLVVFTVLTDPLGYNTLNINTLYFRDFGFTVPVTVPLLTLLLSLDDKWLHTITFLLSLFFSLLSLIKYLIILDLSYKGTVRTARKHFFIMSQTRSEGYTGSLLTNRILFGV